MPTELPPGRYLSCAFRVSPDAGGQTRALLMRNRTLATLGGVRPDVLTFGAATDHDERRATLLERGLLIEPVGLLNIYEHFRERGWGDRPATGEPLPDLSRHRVEEEAAADGSPWRIRYRVPGSRRAVYDYLRRDGSPYLRIPSFGLSDRSSWPDSIQQIGESGELLGEFRTIGQWFRRWIRDLAADHERTFVFMDSRFFVPHVVPMRGKGIHLIYLMHNLHVQPPYNWDSPASRVYERVLARIGGLDAMVTLTERQRDDIAARRGRTRNMFVVPNPVDMPPPPAKRVRDPNQVTILARLARQKRLTHAISAFHRVLEAVPSARLDIYGDGPERERLQEEIDRRGLGGSITLRGFDSRAGEALWTSSAFLMTSLFEGYPLSTLESMSRGCPVVSYDIKYGPREQITEGVDGFLVPEGDTAQLARRVIELLRSPGLGRRMSAAALRTAQRHGSADFLERWAGVAQATIDLKPARTRIDGIELELTRLRAVPGGRAARLARRGRDFTPTPASRGSAVQLTGVLRVDGHSRRSQLDSAQLGLAAIDESGAVTELPMHVRHTGNEFRLDAILHPADVFRGATEAATVVRLRLRFTWQNSAWETEIARPAGDRDAIEISFTAANALRLTRSAA